MKTTTFDQQIKSMEGKLHHLRVKRREAANPTTLSCRAENCLRNEGYKLPIDVQEVARILIDGDDDARSKFLRISNMGLRTLLEINTWIGKQVPRSRERVYMYPAQRRYWVWIDHIGNAYYLVISRNQE